MKKPNVLLILCDQLRRQSVGHLGGPVPTPNMDRLAVRGATFTQAFSNNPMCTPARAALLTGRHPHALTDESGQPYWCNDRLLNPDEVGLAKCLRDAGYACGYIGKWHNDRCGFGAHVPAGPRRHGFDDYWAGYHAAHPHDKPFYYEDDGTRVECGEVWEPDVQVDLALDYMGKRGKGEKPFFLFLSFGPPHTPFDLPPTRQYLVEQVRKASLPLVPNVPAEVADLAREELVAYHANVLGLDDALGRLLDGLKTAGLEQDTLVVFTSDHGSQLFNHGLREKNQFFEESVGIPLALRWPGHVRAALQSDAFVHLSDVAPTLLDLCNVPVPERMQGQSLARVIRGETSAGPHRMAHLEACLPLWDFTFGQGPQGNRRCLVTPEWKLVLIESRNGQGIVTPLQLFDRRKDPFEMRNLAADPGHHWTLCRLVHEWLPLMEKLEDPFRGLIIYGR